MVDTVDTLAAFARLRGVTPQAVTKWNNKGLVVRTPDGRIDVQASHAAIDGVRRVAADSPQRPTASAVPPVPREPDPYQEARARREKAQADLAEMELAVRQNGLVDRGAADRERFATGRQTRDRLMALPMALAHLLAAESDPQRVRQILSAEIRRVLEDLAREMDEVTDDDADPIDDVAAA